MNLLNQVDFTNRIIPMRNFGENGNNCISVIDLTLSDDDSDNKKESENANSVKSIKSEVDACDECPFKPAINISGNLLDCRAHRILLNPSAWFTDELINAYFSILQTRSPRTIYAFSSFFYSSLVAKGEDYCRKHWLKDFKAALATGSLEKVLFPINANGTHWVLVVWSVEAGKLEYFDSLMSRRSGGRIMKKLSNFFDGSVKEAAVYKKNAEEGEDESIIDKLSSLTISTDEPVSIIKDTLIPKGQSQQTDGSSCGAFCCLNAARSCFEDDSKYSCCDIYEFRSSLIELFVRFKRK